MAVMSLRRCDSAPTLSGMLRETTCPTASDDNGHALNWVARLPSAPTKARRWPVPNQPSPIVRERVEKYLGQHHKDFQMLEEICTGFSDQAVFKAACDGVVHIVKAPRRCSPSALAAAASEFSVCAWAASQGFAPAAVSFHQSCGIALYEYVLGETLCPTQLEAKTDGAKQAMTQLRQLHSAQPPQNLATFEPCRRVNQKLSSLLQQGLVSQALYAAIVRRQQSAARMLSQYPTTLCVCHIDYHCGNIIKNGTRSWIIDWEEAALGDPAWDVAYLAVAADLPSSALPNLLKFYHGTDASSTALMRIQQMYQVCSLDFFAWSMTRPLLKARCSHYLQQGLIAPESLVAT